MTKKILWTLFASLAIIIGLYPSVYFFLDRQFGLLKDKDAELLSNVFWNITFYIHIVLGGIALLIGWSQFSPKFREKKLNLHRQIGKIYVVASLLSALTSLNIAYHATGGIISQLGFTCLGVIWLITTWKAYSYILEKKVSQHKKMMILSYAACFAAVTLRLWLPILAYLYHDFLPAYRLVAWLCWVPNLLVALFIINRMNKELN
ncbi:DUF2306 domain-containing protein [Pedobacter sp. PAMC26386]|nr:DUF2306 domain-containing protein [Pedobacter sp. PAMC26386]